MQETLASTSRGSHQISAFSFFVRRYLNEGVKCQMMIKVIDRSDDASVWSVELGRVRTLILQYHHIIFISVGKIITMQPLYYTRITA